MDYTNIYKRGYAAGSETMEIKLQQDARDIIEGEGSKSVKLTKILEMLKLDNDSITEVMRDDENRTETIEPDREVGDNEQDKGDEG